MSLISFVVKLNGASFSVYADATQFPELVVTAAAVQTFIQNYVLSEASALVTNSYYAYNNIWGLYLRQNPSIQSSSLAVNVSAALTTILNTRG